MYLLDCFTELYTHGSCMVEINGLTYACALPLSVESFFLVSSLTVHVELQLDLNYQF